MISRLLAASPLFACLFSFAIPYTVLAQVKYEAEGGYPLVKRTLATVGSRNGVGYAENITQVGAAVAFTVSVPTAGMYKVSARYAAAREYNWTMSVYINDEDVAQAQFATTASLASWSTQAVTVALQEGDNTIKYQYDADDSGWINLDYILVSPAISPGYTVGAAAAGALPAELGVDKFTGTASFDAQLYTMSIPGFSLPIGLHYAATGVQADDTGGEVGLNWSLQAGLSIQRQVRDLPDDIRFVDPIAKEHRFGWLRYPTGSPTPTSRMKALPNAPSSFSATNCAPDEQDILNQLLGFGYLNHMAGNSYELYDTEPDIFTYSVPGYSGKFVFDGTGGVRLLPYAAVQITPILTNQRQQVDCAPITPADELAGFTIKTAEGIVYTFNVAQRTSQLTQSTATSGNAKFLLRHFWDFKINQYSTGTQSPPGPTSLEYNTAWFIHTITTPVATASSSDAPDAQAALSELQAANTVSFSYDCATFTPKFKSTSNLFALGTATAVSADHSSVSEVLNNPTLTGIKTATALATFYREVDEWDNFHVSTLSITSPLEGNTLIKSYVFKYEAGGRFLESILLRRSESELPLYAFTYARDVDAGGELPFHSSVKTSVNQDYWGFVNNNRASMGIPRLYVYPQLLATAVPRPGAPYRLYPVPGATYQTGSFVLPGADRRPANRLSVALAGTLTGVTFATGGKVALEYEQNQFYDPVAQQSLPAGGLRIRTIKTLDPVTRVESRRDYGYQKTGAGSAGISSGVLLHIPRFAFVMPLMAPTDWAQATVRTIDELAPDPFESRPVGYEQVTESVPGKGQVITTFAVPAGADDNMSPGETDDSRPASQLLPAWHRPVFGIARPRSSCPSIAPLQRLSELYPFAAAPNYEFCRGMPLRVQYRAAATGTMPGALVRQETYTYQYINTRPGTDPVVGLRYEQLGDPGRLAYAYAKDTLLTDYLYVPRQQVTSQFVAGGSTSRASVDYRYNSQGWLAAKILTGSDGVVTRTRYKYLSDYALPTGATGELGVMRARIVEGITSDPVETISEIRPAGTLGHVLYAGATLQTFTTSTVPDDIYNVPVKTPTHPFELRRWQFVEPVQQYDSVLVSGNALHIPAELRVASTVVDVDANLNALSVRTRAGRQTAGKHLGYGGLVPLLQIANARASEVIFSDFETRAKPYSFFLANSTSHSPFVSGTSAHTGNQGCSLFAGTGLTVALPASTAPQYRLTFWARNPTPNTGALTSTLTVQPGTTPAIAFSFSHAADNEWRRYEAVLPLGSLANRPSYTLALMADAANSALLQIDDVLLLPVDAAATSTTYTLATGKTSETDERGRNTYYEYAPTGNLALVRDHNKAIEHQYQKVLPGQRLQVGISFATSGTMQEQKPVSFTAIANLSGALQYKWAFGDGQSDNTNNPQPTHVYAATGQNTEYTVRLTVSSQGTDYVYTQSIYILPTPLELTTCISGVVRVDDCYKGDASLKIDKTCNPNMPDANSTTAFKVIPSLGGVNFKWEYFDDTQSNPGWLPVTNGDIAAGSPTSSTITVLRVNSNRFRCRVNNGVQTTVSDEFSIEHFKSNLDCVP